MLASMSGIDRRADTPLVDWSDPAVSGLLPTGTVTLLLADVEGSTRLGEAQPDEMTAAAMARYAYDQIDEARAELNAVSKIDHIGP
jgi:class 3 adenylate cyclase